MSCFSAIAKCQITLETKNEKEHYVLERVEPWPKNLVSLPLVSFPMGQSIETTDSNYLHCRGAVPAVFKTLPNHVEIEFQVSSLRPRIVPHTDFKHSRYLFSPTMQNALVEEKQQLYVFPAISVDTTFLSKSIVYKEGLDPENIETISDSDLDPNILLHYQTGQEVKTIPADPRLKNYYPKPVFMTGVERVFDEQKRFQCLKTVAECANKDFLVWATFDIVPIRQEAEYLEYFSMSTERTLTFRSLIVHMPLPKVPEMLSRWLKVWSETKPVLKEKEKEKEEPLIETTDMDLTSEFAIPLVPDRLESWFEQGKDMLYMSHYDVDPADHKDEIRQANTDELYETIKGIVHENYATMRREQEARFVRAQDYLLETTPEEAPVETPK